MRGVTPYFAMNSSTFKISTHTPHARRDDPEKVCNQIVIIFQLTRLMRGVTWNSKSFIFIIEIYFNSHASCEA